MLYGPVRVWSWAITTLGRALATVGRSIFMKVHIHTKVHMHTTQFKDNEVVFLGIRLAFPCMLFIPCVPMMSLSPQQPCRKWWACENTTLMRQCCVGPSSAAGCIGGDLSEAPSPHSPDIPKMDCFYVVQKKSFKVLEIGLDFVFTWIPPKACVFMCFA